MDFDSNHENRSHNQRLETEGMMAHVNGSQTTSSPAWNTYKTAPIDPGHHFSPPPHRRAISLHPDLTRPNAGDKETSPPPPKEELEPEVHHTNPMSSPKFGEESSPLRHHLDAAPDVNLSRVRTPFISALFWTHPHPQQRPLTQVRCDSGELAPQNHGVAGRLFLATIASPSLDPSHPSWSQPSRLDQSHTSSFRKILALHLNFNGS
jgi:hypothetical protein